MAVKSKRTVCDKLSACCPQALCGKSKEYERSYQEKQNVVLAEFAQMLAL
jgi:hypothetical protein